MTIQRLWIIGMIAASAVCAQDHQSHLTQAIDKGLLVATHAMPVVRLLDADPVKRETGRRMADAVIFNAALTQALKLAIDSPRPHGGQDGFPSGHTSSAFTVAMSLTEREPEMAWFAFPLAAAAGWARVDLEEHTWGQVLAGAALGAFVGHMCGTGQWRLFGHRNLPREEPASFEQFSGLSPETNDPWPVAVAGFDWGTTVWSTTF